MKHLTEDGLHGRLSGMVSTDWYDDSLGFRVSEASFSGSVYGKVFEIDDYLTGAEMERIAAMVSTEAQDADIFPNHSLWENHAYAGACTKTQLLWDNWDSIVKWSSDADVWHVSGHSMFRYRETDGLLDIRERLQVSPAHMREYEPHTDYGSKALTILVPIAPGVSEPTRFHGLDGNATARSLPWVINKAYMFRPTMDHSYHSYVGGEADRYVLNINFLF